MLLRLFKYLLTWCGVGVSKARYAWINSGAFLASQEWIELRYRVLRESDGRCCLCGRGAIDGAKLHALESSSPLHSLQSRQGQPRRRLAAVASRSATLKCIVRNKTRLPVVGPVRSQNTGSHVAHLARGGLSAPWGGGRCGNRPALLSGQFSRLGEGRRFFPRRASASLLAVTYPSPQAF
jgi:hypothetical protein